MRGFRRAGLVLFSVLSLAAAVSFDLTELRNKVAKIKVNPRGNLWATGHFMGKKSVMDAPLLPSAQAAGALDVTVPAEPSALRELFQDFLTFRAQLETRGRSSKEQEEEEEDLLMKILERYIQSRK